MERIEKVYCVSLKDEIHRRKMMKEQLDNLFPNKYIFIDATTINSSIVPESINNLMSYGTNINSVSQVAINYSHLECMIDIYKNKYNYAIVIEDDIRIINNFENLLNTYFKNTQEQDPKKN